MYPTFAFAKHKQGNAAVNTKRIAVGSPLGRASPKGEPDSGTERGREPSFVSRPHCCCWSWEPKRHPNKHLSNNNHGSWLNRRSREVARGAWQQKRKRERREHRTSSTWHHHHLCQKTIELCERNGTPISTPSQPPASMQQSLALLIYMRFVLLLFAHNNNNPHARNRLCLGVATQCLQNC